MEKYLLEIDKLLYSIKVNGEDVFSMAKARTLIKEVYGLYSKEKEELNAGSDNKENK